MDTSSYFEFIFKLLAILAAGIAALSVLTGINSYAKGNKTPRLIRGRRRDDPFIIQLDDEEEDD